MKKLLLSTCLFFSVIASNAQSWAAPGATWYYDYGSPISSGGYSGYERISKIGDTLINGKQFDVLEVFHRSYNFFDNSYHNAVVAHEYTRADSGVVYYFRDAAEYVLYDFSAQVGDSWLVRTNVTGFSCDTGTVTLDSTSSTIVNGDTLKVLYTSPDTWSLGRSLFMGRIIEKIGSIMNLFPYPACLPDVDQGFGLRCYSDSSGWLYRGPFFNNSCDDMVGIFDHEQPPAVLTLQPNPVSDVLHMQYAGRTENTRLTITDVTGRILRSEPFRETINVRDLSPGIYLLSLQGTNLHTTVRFVRK